MQHLRRERRRAITDLASIPATLVLYEAPHRLVETLADLAELMGERPAAVARELTKRFEEVRRESLPQLARFYAEQGPPRGEIVLVIAAPQAGAAPVSQQEIDAALQEAMQTARVRDAASEVAARFGLPRREVYARALALRRGSPEWQ